MKEKLECEVYPRFFSAFEHLLKDHGDGFFYGSDMTIADLAVYPVLQWLTSSIVSPSTLDPYPLLKALFEKIEADERVKAYYVHEKARESAAAEAAAATEAAEAESSKKP